MKTYTKVISSLSIILIMYLISSNYFARSNTGSLNCVTSLIGIIKMSSEYAYSNKVNVVISIDESRIIAVDESSNSEINAVNTNASWKVCHRDESEVSKLQVSSSGKIMSSDIVVEFSPFDDIVSRLFSIHESYTIIINDGVYVDYKKN